MECNACGATYRDGGKFCPKCGSASEARPFGSVCRKCGSSVKPGGKFCNYCGAPQTANTVETGSAASNAGSNPGQNPVPIVATLNQPNSLSAHTPSIASRNNQTTKPAIPAQRESNKPKRSRKVVLAGSLIFLLALAAGGYWYANDDLGLLDRITTGEERPAAVSMANTPPVPISPPNPAKVDGGSDATEKPPSAANEKEQGQQLPIPDPKLEPKPIVAPKTPNGAGANGKPTATPPTQTQKKSPKSPPPSEVARTETVDVTTMPSQAPRTCINLGGIYRLTCEIEGAEKYFKCAPDGRTWKHNVDGCDRK